MAHQEFIERIGDVSPVHIHELEELGSRRIKETKRNPNVPNGINQGKPTKIDDFIGYCLKLVSMELNHIGWISFILQQIRSHSKQMCDKSDQMILLHGD